MPPASETVAVIGNGIIGHGAAELFAGAGHDVRLIGRSEASLAKALERIRASLALFRENGLVTDEAAEATLGRIRTSTRIEDAAPARLVFEAVPEDMNLKTEIFGQLDALCAPRAVLATGSGHGASEVVAKVRHRNRVVAAQLWFPPQLIPLVEVVPGPETDKASVQWLCALLKAAGKEPVVIDREVPGFIGNRIQFAALREAWALWAAGVASAEAIDAVVRYSFGRRLAVTGPIESADVAGLDTMYHFARFLQPDLDAQPLPPEAIRRMVEGGDRGMPSGRGIYDWTRRDGEALLLDRRRELIRWLKADKAAREGGG